MSEISPYLLAKQAEQQQREKLANDIIETQIKIISAVYDKAVAYTNIVIIGGYAGFFGLWTLTKQYLTAAQARWSALFMLTSASIFIFFEVYKMVITTKKVLLPWAKILEDPDDRTNPDMLLDKLHKYEQSLKRNNLPFIRIWWIHVAVAVVTALIAVSILLFSFVCGLLGTT